MPFWRIASDWNGFNFGFRVWPIITKHACRVLNGNVFRKHEMEIMIMKKHLCARLKGHWCKVTKERGKPVEERMERMIRKTD